jgi:hypothetical protein
MEISTKTLKIKTGNQSTQQPHELPGFHHSLEYIFDEPVRPGPTLTREITLVPKEELGEVLPDIEIAKLMLLPTPERFKKAPYAYQANGQVQPEYRHVIKKHMDEIGATDAQKKHASPRGYEFEEWTPEKIEMIAQQRAEKAATAHWEIDLKVPIGYKSLPDKVRLSPLP